MVSRASWIPGSFKKAWLLCTAAMKRAWLKLSAACACVVDHYRIPTSYSSTISLASHTYFFLEGGVAEIRMVTIATFLEIIAILGQDSGRANEITDPAKVM